MNKYNYNGDPKFRPLSPWEYFGYGLLFSLPVAGFVLLIVFTFNSSNINCRNFARSYWCSAIIAGVIILVLLALVLLLGGLAGLSEFLSSGIPTDVSQIPY